MRDTVAEVGWTRQSLRRLVPWNQRRTSAGRQSAVRADRPVRVAWAKGQGSKYKSRLSGDVDAAGIRVEALRVCFEDGCRSSGTGLESSLSGSGGDAVEAIADLLSIARLPPGHDPGAGYGVATAARQRWHLAIRYFGLFGCLLAAAND